MAKRTWAPLAVVVEDDNVIFVGSETVRDGWYQVFWDGEKWKCTCKDYLRNKEPCKHINAYLETLSETEGGRGEEEGEHVTSMIIPPPPTQNGMAKWIVTIHGKETIRYQGLLAMAHAQGLMHFGARFTEVTEKRATAWAWAHFKDGRKFYEAGDATSDNVQPGVRKAWMRMALTRAKARMLRDALNIGIVSTEELED
jgi:hypothetical protein